MARETLAVNITGRGADLSREFSKVGVSAEKSAKKTSSAWGKVGKAGKAAGIAVGVGAAAVVAGAVAIGTASVKAAVEDEKSQALLRQALKNNLGERDRDVKGIEKWITATQNASGVADDDLRPALATTLRATGEITEAQSLLTTAMDISTATGKPLAAVTIALGKAYQGNVGGLAKLGIATKDNAGKTLAFSKKIFASLKDKFGGTTAAAAGTMAGQMERMKVRFEDVKEEIGQKLIPVLLGLATFVTAKLIPAIAAATAYFQEHLLPGIKRTVAWVKENWPKLIEAITPTLLKIKGYIEGFVTTVQALWKRFGDRIMEFVKSSFESIRLAIKGALDLIMGIVRLFHDLFTGKWGKLWGDVKQIAKGTWELIWSALRQVWEKIRLGLGLVWDAIKTKVHNVWNGIVGWFKGIPGRIGGALTTLATVIAAPFKAAAELAVAAINLIIKAWNLIPGHKNISELSLPWQHAKPPGGLYGTGPGNPPPAPFYGPVSVGARASGGRVSRYGSYLVGERGPELLTMGAGSGMVHPNVGNTMVVNINIPNGALVGTKRELGQVVSDAIIAYERANGRRYSAVVNP